MMNAQAPVLLALHRIGPYHHARFQAAAAQLDSPLVVLETRPQSCEYPWQFSADQQAYTSLKLSVDVDPEQDLPPQKLRDELNLILSRCRPKAVVTVGWADRAYLQILQLCQKMGIPLVVISDSRHCDQPRSVIKELLKRQLLRGYSSAVVAGKQSRDYLIRLGFSPHAIYQPWDVVDNDLFSRLSDSFRSETKDNQPFLCVGRLIPEKNHALLLEAFSLYQQQGGLRSLQLVGSGPLESELMNQCQNLPDPTKVSLIPFEQLEDLAQRYASAWALILPSSKDTWGLVVNEALAASLPVIVSSACGCVDDLIQDGITGWSFSANSSQELLKCLWNVEHQSMEQRHKLVLNARKRLEAYQPASFAVGLASACDHATKNFRSSIKSRVFSSLICKFGWV